MSSVPKTLLTPQEYLARERKAEFKSEYYRGEMFAMARANWNHTLIKDNAAAAVWKQIKNNSGRVLTSDLRVLVDRTGLYTYPDIIVVCDAPKFEDRLFDTLLNPRVLMEVLSESSADYDRGDKFKHYRQIASLQEYIFIAQDEPYVERHVRQANGDWVMTEIRGLDSTLEFVSILAKIALVDIYRGVGFADGAMP